MQSLLNLVTEEEVTITLKEYLAQIVKTVHTMQEGGLIPGLGISPEEGNDSFQYSCLENPLDRGAWWAIGHGVTKNLEKTY